MTELNDIFRLPSATADLSSVDGDDDAQAVARVIRLATGVATDEDWQAVRSAAKTWLSTKGDVPFERCLRLPTTPDAFRLMQRNYWLCEAAIHIDAASEWQGCVQLRSEWDRFMSRGPWREWRDDPDPPGWATSLSRALFFASHFHRGGDALCEKQLSRLVGHIFRRKCQRPLPTLTG